jgi:hypothetical protein
MLDPLTALGLAASIIQLVEFGGKVLSTGYAINQAVRKGKEALEEDLQLGRLTQDLEDVNAKLLSALSANSGPLSREDERLQELAVSCQDTAVKLLDILDDQKVKEKAPFKEWAALKKAIKKARRQSEVQRLEEQLTKYRQQLSTNLLSVIR